MASAESTSPKWPSLSAFCGECAYSAVCPLATLAEVENCEFVREQRALDLDAKANGGERLLAPSPFTYGSVIVREAKERRGARRELDYTKRHRGRRQLHEIGVRWLLTALFTNPSVQIALSRPVGRRANSSKSEQAPVAL